MPCPRTQHRNNVPILKGEEHEISLKTLHQAGFETARQAVTLAKLRVLAIAPRPSLDHMTYYVEWAMSFHPTTIYFCSKPLQH